jgi:hypothetical protein
MSEPVQEKESRKKRAIISTRREAMTPKQPNRDELLQMTRRYFFKVCGYGSWRARAERADAAKIVRGKQQEPSRA